MNTQGKKFTTSKTGDGLVSALYKALQQISKKRQKENPIEKWAKKKDIDSSQKLTSHNYVTMCSNSLVIIEIQSKATMISLSTHQFDKN